jgi:FtsP/CotA-like multicopper oxidase with cupredoxin domain
LPPLPNDQRPIPDGEIVDRKTLKFTVQENTGIGNNPKFLIAVNDGPPSEFDPNVVNECVEVDTAEEWTYENYSGVGHPCHIHLNPFFVTDFFDPNDPPNPDSPHGQNMKYNDPVGLWQDTIIVPAAKTVSGVTTPGKVTFRHRFAGITGTFVMHCHILGHEDRGFMHVVQVHAKGQPCSPPCPHTG